MFRLFHCPQVAKKINTLNAALNTLLNPYGFTAVNISHHKMAQLSKIAYYLT